MLREQLVRCLRDPRFDRIDLVVSFIMTSGVDLISGALSDALARGARVRILTTDYLGVTDPDALTGLLDLMDVPDHEIDVRIFHDELTSFHPKSYIFRSADGSTATAFVGSSNLSASGISGGIEWNLGVEEIGALVSAFERLWWDERTLSLTHDWLRAYREKPRISPVGVVPEPPVQPAEPWPIQRDALGALEATREEGHRAGLVVMATGLGKTWLAAFDATWPEFRRVLFVAHREEILRQSRDVFRRVRPDADLGFFDGTHEGPDARVLFASIQTPARHLDAFDPSDFATTWSSTSPPPRGVALSSGPARFRTCVPTTPHPSHTGPPNR